MNIKNGWKFLSADFSTQASGREKEGRVTLVRDKINLEKWHNMAEEEKEKEDCPEIYVKGYGVTIEKAIKNANLAADNAKPIINL